MKWAYLSRSGPSISGSLEIPGSKSISNRALILQSVFDPSLEINNLSTAQDTQDLIAALNHSDEAISAGEGGTTFRFLLAALTLLDKERELSASGMMKERPIGSLVEALNSIGANIDFIGQTGFPPVSIHSAVPKGGTLQVDGSLSSQYISALLLIGAKLENGISIQVNSKLVSNSYINLTVKMLEYFGIKTMIERHSYSVTPQSFLNRPLIVEPDWTHASYYYAIAALIPGSEIYLKNLSLNSWQGDSILPEIMVPFGIETIVRTDGLVIRSVGTEMKEFEIDATDHPDLVPTLSVLCSALNIKAVFKGVDHLKYKESPRMAVLSKELIKIGTVLKNEGNYWKLLPGKSPPNGIIKFNTYSDHRMVMSFAVLVFKYGNIGIENPDAVNKSYPGFWDHLNLLGIKLNYSVN